jgi:hypothetical protein
MDNAQAAKAGIRAAHGIIWDSPDRDLMFLIQAKARLKLEIQIPGLRFNTSKSTMSLVNDKYGRKFRRKQHALDFVQKTLEEYKQ